MRRRPSTIPIHLIALTIAAAGCSGAQEDGRDDTFLDGSGKADTAGIWEGTPQAIGVLAVANTVSLEVLVAAPLHGVGLSQRAVDNIADFRLGDDGLAGTADDGVFDTLAELDAIPFIGRIAFEKLLEYAIEHGYVMNGGSPDAGIASCLGSNANVECAGDELCELCLSDGECADGPNPIWRDNECWCMGDPRLDCQLAWCCSPTTHWDAAACEAAGTWGDYCVPN